MSTNPYITPLHGVKTHPLTKHALKVLDDVRFTFIPCSRFNAGVVNRLERENLVTFLNKPSPFKSSAGKDIPHMKASDEGLKALEEARQREVGARRL